MTPEWIAYCAQMMGHALRQAEYRAAVAESAGDSDAAKLEQETASMYEPAYHYLRAGLSPPKLEISKSVKAGLR